MDDHRIKDAGDLDSISGVFLIKADRSLLLQLRDDIPTIHRPGYWVVPGGHCESGENCEECARREFLEETAYDCKELSFINSVIDNADGYVYWLHMFWSLYDERQELICREGQELKFIRREEAGNYLRIDLLVQYWDVVIEKLNRSRILE